MDIREQIEEMKKSLNISNDNEFADLLDISQPAISAWIKRGKIPEKILYKVKDMVNIRKVNNESDITNVKIDEAKNNQNQNKVEFIGFKIPDEAIMIPEYGSPVHAGSPAVAYDDLVGMVNATRHLHAQSYYVRVKGRSMEGKNIKEGMRLLVDSRMEARNGNTVIALVNGEYTVKVFQENGEQWLLNPDPDPDNKDEFHAIVYDDSKGNMKIVGVVVRSEQDFV